MKDFPRASSLLPIARKFCSDAVRVAFLRQSHNLIYRVECGQSEDFFLRLTAPLHRRADEIAGELAFQLYLGDKALGHIHRLSKVYVPAGTEKRRQWSESQHLLRAPALLQAYNPALCGVFHECMAEIKNLPADEADFGLTHGDYLLSNYMITEDNRVTVFDFDECEYAWYAMDLAICMHCYLIGPAPALLPAQADTAASMLYDLLRGYTSETPVSREMLLRLHSFFKVRDFIYLSSILEKNEKLTGWNKSFAETCTDRMLNRRPFLEFSMERALELL